MAHALSKDNGRVVGEKCATLGTVPRFNARTSEEITHKIRVFRDERDRAQFHSPKDMAEAITIEAAELLEHPLCTRPGTAADIAGVSKPAFAKKLPISTTSRSISRRAMDEKLAKEGKKYPVSEAKGKNLKYTELSP